MKAKGKKNEAAAVVPAEMSVFVPSGWKGWRNENLGTIVEDARKGYWEPEARYWGEMFVENMRATGWRAKAFMVLNRWLSQCRAMERAGCWLGLISPQYAETTASMAIRASGYPSVLEREGAASYWTDTPQEWRGRLESCWDFVYMAANDFRKLLGKYRRTIERGPMLPEAVKLDADKLEHEAAAMRWQCQSVQAMAWGIHDLLIAEIKAEAERGEMVARYEARLSVVEADKYRAEGKFEEESKARERAEERASEAEGARRKAENIAAAEMAIREMREKDLEDEKAARLAERDKRVKAEAERDRYKRRVAPKPPGRPSAPAVAKRRLMALMCKLCDRGMSAAEASKKVAKAQGTAKRKLAAETIRRAYSNPVMRKAWLGET